MPSEHSEERRTQHALEQVFTYISPGSNEGISFSLSRLTDDLFDDSFLAGGDISRFTATSHRGVIRSQSATGYVLAAQGGAPAPFPVELTVDLGNGECSGTWTLPSGAAQSPSFRLQHVKTTSVSEGTLIVFAGETSSDDSVYSLALLLI